jgi:hypothetical protein
MVTTSNIDQHFGNMAKNWIQKIGQGRAPQRILYLRDGVSEGLPTSPNTLLPCSHYHRTVRSRS